MNPFDFKRQTTWLKQCHKHHQHPWTDHLKQKTTENKTAKNHVDDAQVFKKCFRTLLNTHGTCCTVSTQNQNTDSLNET